MNSLTTTKIYQKMDPIFKLTSIIKNENNKLNQYVIDREHYDYLIQIAKTFRFDLSKMVVKELESGNLKPIFLQDPKEFGGPVIKYPTSISSILIPDTNKKGNIIGLFDVSTNGIYERNPATKEIISFTMNPERSFYACAQRAFISRFVALGGLSLNTNILFVKLVSSIYARVFSVALSGQLGGSSKGDWMQRINYISLVFALQNFFGYDMEKARNYAFAFQSVDKAYIIENSKYYANFGLSNPNILDMSQQGIDKNFAINTKDKKPTSIDIFISIISKEFSDMRRDPLQYRGILDIFTRRYGSNSALAIEHGESFLNMVITSTLKTGFYNDLAVNQQTEPFMADLFKCIIDIYARSTNG